MEELELVCFQIISFAGEARSAYMGAIQTAKQGNYEEIHKEAAGEMEQTPNLLLIHAEDQLMAAETCKILAVELMDAYRRISILEAKEA